MTRRRLLRGVATVVLIPVLAVGSWLLAAGAWLVTAGILYSPEYVIRVITLGESDVNDYLTNFPHRPLTASSTPFRFETVPGEARC